MISDAVKGLAGKAQGSDVLLLGLDLYVQVFVRAPGTQEAMPQGIWSSARCFCRTFTISLQECSWTYCC